MTDTGAFLLVGALQRTGRSDELLGAVDALPRRLQVVLSGLYMEGRDPVELAEQLLLTPRELAQVSAAALRAMGRTVPRPSSVRTPHAHAGCCPLALR